MGVRPGVFDFLLIGPDGRHHWLELKRGGAPLSAAQERFRRELVERDVTHGGGPQLRRGRRRACVEWNVLRPCRVQ